MEEQKIPPHIDRYRVLRTLGRGGSGQVYQVADSTTGEHLALKWLQVGGHAERRFNREYEAAVRLNHPNIVRVFHYGTFEGSPWFTMELVDGVQAQKHIQQMGPVGVASRYREVLRVGACVAQALHYLHQRQLVHRDVKSSNVMVLPDGRVKLLDLGTARVLDAVEITIEGEFVGTYAYASPEQCHGAAADRRSDIYNFGVFMYRLIAGRRPFESEDPAELCRQHVEESPPHLMELLPELDTAFCDLVMACLAKKASDRPESARTVYQELRKLSGTELSLPGRLMFDRNAGQLVGREEDFGKLCRFLDNADSGALCSIEAIGSADGQAFLSMAELQARGADWRVFRCDLTQDLGLYRLVLFLRQVGATFQGSPPKQVQRAIEEVGALCRTWGEDDSSHQPIVEECGRVLLRERFLVDGRPILLQLNQSGGGSADVWRTIGLWAEALVNDEVPMRFVSCSDPNSPIPWQDCEHLFSSVRTIQLAALDEWQTALLVGSLLHRRPPPPSVARRIHNVSGGIPEYVERVVENLVNDGLLESTQFSNRLYWADTDGLKMPSPVQSDGDLARMMMTLPVYGRRVLEILSVVEQPLSNDDLALILGWEIEELQPLLKSVLDEGWLEYTVNHEWALKNPLFGRIALETIEEERLSLYTVQLAQVLGRKAASKPLIVALVNLERLDEAMLEACRLARHHISMLCPQSAMDVLQEVIRVVPFEDKVSHTKQIDVGLLFCQALSQISATDPRLTHVLGWLETHAQTDKTRRAIHSIRAHLQRWLGHYPNYRKMLVDAWKMQETLETPEILSDLARQLGDSHFMAGEMDVARRWFDRGCELAEAASSDLLWAQCEVGRAGVLYAVGQLYEAEFSATRALEIFDANEHLPGMSLAISTWANSLRHQGRLSQALEVLAAAAPILRVSERPSFYLRVLISMARCEMALGRLGCAQECLDELDAMLRPGEHLHLRLQVSLVHAAVQQLSGQGHRAAELLQDVIKRATSAGLKIEAEVGRFYLAEAIWRSDPETAEQYFELSTARLEKMGHVPGLMECCAARARVAQRTTPPDVIFRPVNQVLSVQPTELARLNWAIADAEYTVAQRKDSSHAWHNARLIWDGIWEQLNEIDKSSMHLHPASKKIEEGISAAARDTV